MLLPCQGWSTRVCVVVPDDRSSSPTSRTRRERQLIARRVGSSGRAGANLLPLLHPTPAAQRDARPPSLLVWTIQKSIDSLRGYDVRQSIRSRTVSSLSSFTVLLRHNQPSSKYGLANAPRNMLHLFLGRQVPTSSPVPVNNNIDNIDLILILPHLARPQVQPSTTG